MNFEAKEVTCATAGEVGSILVAAWKAAYKGIMPDDYLEALSTEKRTQRVKASIAENNESIYLFFVDGKPGGTAILNQYRGEGASDADGEISAFYFLPEHWGHGFGKRAMDFCLNCLARRGYGNIRLWVLEENVRARRFYEKCGFAFDGTRSRIHVGKPLMDLRYQKTIGGVL
jgi:Acetyltransferases